MNGSRYYMRSILALVILVVLAACGAANQPTSTAGGGQPAATTQAESPTAAVEASPTAAAEPTSQPPAQGGTLVVMTHDSFSISEDVITQFEQATGAQVQILSSGDAGEALNKAILSKGNPLGDVFFGVDNTFFSLAIEEDLFEPYAPQGLEAIPEDLRLDPENRLIPIDYGYVNLNYDKSYFEEHNLPVPQSLEDLTRPEYKGKLVVQNPATSSPGLAFLLTTIASFGEEGDYTWIDFWRDLRQNEVLVVNGWSDAYFEHFSGASGSQGSYPLVVSYATSPAAEVYFSEGALEEPPTDNILPNRGSFRQIEFAGILKGAKNPELARRWMDFMLSKTFQEDIPLNMFVYPVLPEADLPEVFQQFAPIPEEPATMPPDMIAANRERWIQQWTEVVLR